MDKTKWTPGSWQPYQGADTNWWWVITDSDGSEIGSGDGGFEEADAHLIAAAPELYEALEIAIADGPAGYLEWIETAKTVLAKARGEFHEGGAQ